MFILDNSWQSSKTILNEVFVCVFSFYHNNYQLLVESVRLNDRSTKEVSSLFLFGFFISYVFSFLICFYKLSVLNYRQYGGKVII